LLTACGWGTGSSFMAEPLVPTEEPGGGGGGQGARGRARPPSRTIGDHPAPKENGIAGNGSLDKTGGGGRVLGTFRNTYYDFPSEKAFQGSGPQVSLMNAKCEPIAQVPRGFYEAACVQGSGSLARGGTVSFAKRDCACAEVCPRTNQKICFDALDRQTYPWGRGASGNPISPLRSIAADVSVLAMGTVIYIPELDGIEGSDGCFVVEDRGLKVQGEHVDIFTGDPSRTASLNSQVPSNQGVTIVVDAPACGRLTKR
jgi:3D (Asp-Asp-Asp) domain-containing protein